MGLTDVVESPILKDYYNKPTVLYNLRSVVESPILKDYYNYPLKRWNKD